VTRYTGNDRDYSDVLQHARVYAAGHTHGYMDSFRAADEIARMMNVPTRGGAPDGRFARQVVRALNALAAEGTLVKIPRGDYHPGGAYENAAAWYTKDAYAAAMLAAQEAREEQIAVENRWEDVHEALHAAGLPARGIRRGPPGLELDGWEQLAAILRKAAR
jgi:hypothetical protein